MDCRTESGVTYKQTYNAENRIASIQKLASGTCSAPGNLTAKWDFTYDGDGTRTGQLYTPYTDGQPGTAVVTRYYFGGAYETTDGAWKKYYSFGGTTLMRDSAANSFKYFLSDHLGSVSVVLDDEGTILEQQRYLPFGGVRTDIATPPYRITSTDFTYTGQRNIDGTGLMDYKARFYSPTLGRFVQPDTIIPSVTSSQSWNRCSYVQNSPIVYNDPTGHMRTVEEGGGSEESVVMILLKKYPCAGQPGAWGANCRKQRSKDKSNNTAHPVAVPVPVPPGSPSVPISTTEYVTSVTYPVVVTDNFQPIPLPNGWTTDPKNPVGAIDLIGWFMEAWNAFGFANKKGESQDIQEPHFFPRAWRDTYEITTITRTTFSTDQYGNTTVDIQHSTTWKLISKEENMDGLWVITYPSKPGNDSRNPFIQFPSH